MADIVSMTADEKNRRIAEWLEPVPTWDYEFDGYAAWSPRRVWTAHVSLESNGRGPWRPAHDYTSDLNACAEFEKKLEGMKEKLGYFEAYLVAVAKEADTQLLSEAWIATPEQRCDALLRVLEELREGR